MSGNAFRSHLMQQFVAAARTNHRPSPAIGGALNRTSRTSHFHTNPQVNKQNNKVDSIRINQDQSAAKRDNSSSPLRDSFHFSTSSYCNETAHHNTTSSIHTQQHRLYHTTHTNLLSLEAEGESENQNNNFNFHSFQNILKTRRTTTNFLPLHEFTLSQKELLHDAIYRAIECAVQAPNHYRTEPTTYYRIMPNTKSWEGLLDITYNVAFLQHKSKSNSTEEVAKMKAENKKMKWRNTVGGYIVVTVSGQPDQEQEDGDSSNVYDIIPLHPPETERQIEDYASACASIQNILLSLHSEGLGAKWATGSIPRCKAMRELIGCRSNDLIAGLVMVGIPKSETKEWRKKRTLAGNVLIDL